MSGVQSCRCPLGSRKDRHENIGRGMIGIECFKHLMNDSRMDGIPLIVEARPLRQVKLWGISVSKNMHAALCRACKMVCCQVSGLCLLS